MGAVSESLPPPTLFWQALLWEIREGLVLMLRPIVPVEALRILTVG